MFRLFHQSSHLGDEFLLRTQTERVNLSYEAWISGSRTRSATSCASTAAAGCSSTRSPSNLDPWSVQYGLEFISPWPSRDRRLAARSPPRTCSSARRTAGRCDLSLRAGIQIDGVLASRNLQLLLEYFQGHSPNGQFYKDKIEYFGLGAHFHF